MAFVTIRVLDDTPTPAPIEGISVSFYTLGAVFQTSGITDDAGEAVVELPDASYDVTFYKAGVSILPRQPQRIIVSSLLVNTFLVTAHERTRPESVDPRRCTVSGYVRGVAGQKSQMRLIFALTKELTVLDNSVIEIDGRYEIASDEAGYFQFELLRGQTYFCYFLYVDSLLGAPPPASLKIMVPDQASADLTTLLFPFPVAAEFSDEIKTLLLGDDPDESVAIVILWSDGSSRWENYGWGGVKLVNSEPSVVDFSISEGKVILKPLSPGVAVLSIERLVSHKVLFDPLDDFTSGSLTVTVEA